MRKKFLAAALGLLFTGASVVGISGTANAAGEDLNQPILLKGSTTASYFWDDSSGRAGDTGLPASGKPMQKGMAASPSWPLFTEGYAIYNGKRAPFWVGDRGPGSPSSDGVMLDLDAKTFADLTGGEFNSNTLMIDGNGGEGHIKIQYVITKWGDGVGKKDYPVAFSTGAWNDYDSTPAKPIRTLAMIKADKAKAAAAKAEKLKAAKLEAEKVEAEKLKAEKAKADKIAADRAAAADLQASRSKDRTAKNDTASAVASDISPAADGSLPTPALFAALLLVVGGIATFVVSRRRLAVAPRHAKGETGAKDDARD